MSTSSATTRSASPTAEPSAERLVRLANGLTLCVEDVGEGPPLVLIMGIGGQLVHWPDGFRDRLVEAGYRVIRFDNREVGRSTRLEHLPVPSAGRTMFQAMLGMRSHAPYALEDMAEDTALLLDALDIEDAHVVGISMGGMIAQTLAITHPQRLRSLTSMMSSTGQTGVYISEPKAMRALFSKPPRTRDEAMQNAVRFWTTVGSTGFEKDLDALRETAGRAWDRGSYPVGVLRQFAAIGASGDRTPRLRFVKTPTLVLHGTVDPLIRPVGGRMTAAAIEGARLELIEGMGHDLPHGAWPTLVGHIVEHARRADGRRADG